MAGGHWRGIRQESIVSKATGSGIATALEAIVTGEGHLSLPSRHRPAISGQQYPESTHRPGLRDKHKPDWLPG